MFSPSLQDRFCHVVFVLLCFFSIPGRSWRKNWRLFRCEEGVKVSGKKEALDLTFYSRCHIFYGTGTRMWSVLKHSWRRTPIIPLVELREMCSWLLHYLPSLPTTSFSKYQRELTIRTCFSALINENEPDLSCVRWLINGCKLNYNSIQFLPFRSFRSVLP